MGIGHPIGCDCELCFEGDDYCYEEIEIEEIEIFIPPEYAPYEYEDQPGPDEFDLGGEG